MGLAQSVVPGASGRLQCHDCLWSGSETGTTGAHQSQGRSAGADPDGAPYDPKSPKGGVPDRPHKVPDVTYKKKGTHITGGVPDRPHKVPDVTYKKKGTHIAGEWNERLTTRLLLICFTGEKV
ncbi:hypothetical protein NDU88_001174 [Pleurodeles waltl]|uniref:Uncharacterized protein n=1 Tax=Pleurodeles waltl TaxID=8319 RepID=A0AAV7LC06_PLEWA|nr:hypothetical protein NDU88_001174 [Pleurodeles waltl]